MALTQVPNSMLAFDGGPLGMRNRIINGDMRIDQRNAGAAVTQGTSVAYTVDRFYCQGAVASKFTVQQNAGSVTPPVGFTNYLGVTSSAATTVGASDAYFIRHVVEGYNVADLAFGTANAQSITISFLVRSSLTGTFGLSLVNSAASRAYPATYTINAANTWEQKTITVSGDTTGTWVTNNGVGLNVTFGLGYGSSLSGTANAWNAGTAFMPTGATSVVGTSGATFYITGVQLEVGTVATPFERRMYGQELALCQRYYYEQQVEIQNPAVGSVLQRYNFPVSMRAAPVIANKTAGTLSNASILNDGGSITTQGFFFQVSIAAVNGFITGRINTVSAEL